MPPRPLIFFLALLLWTPGLSAQTLDDAVVLKTRADAVKTLSAEVAAQIPGYFNFKRYALVWIPYELATNAVLEIHEPDTSINSNDVRFSLSTILQFEFKKTSTIITVWTDRPCETGDGMLPEAYKQCLASVASSSKDTRKKARLFAIPKSRLKSLKTLRRDTDPRP